MKLLSGLSNIQKHQGSILRGMGLLAGAGAGLAGYALLHEPMAVRLDRLNLRIPNARGRLPRNGLRILHLTDTHFQGLQWREERKIKRIHEIVAGLEYDLLIHTGDFWHNEAGQDNLLKLFDGLPKPRLGAYGVLGNHDYACYSHGDVLSRNWEHYQNTYDQNVDDSTVNTSNINASARLVTNFGPYQNRSIQNGSTSHSQEQVRSGVYGVGQTQSARMSALPNKSSTTSLRARVRDSYRFMQYFLNTPFELERISYNDVARLEEMLDSRQMKLLQNRSVRVQHNVGQSDGVDIYLAGVDDVSEGHPDTSTALSDTPDDAVKLLLSHNPDILHQPDSLRAQLILCGHTHGGQIRLPFVGAVHTHSALLGRHEASGYMRREQTQIFISRGVGEGIPLRFGAAPQIAYITLHAE